MTKPKLVAIIGPSTAGKTEISKALQLKQLVSSTTRPKRVSEVDGEDYHFLSTGEFAELVMQDALVEHVENYGKSYGIRKSDVDAVLAQDHLCYVIATYPGYEALKEYMPEGTVFSVFVAISKEDMETRMRERGDTEESKNKRLDAYDEEMKTAELCDFIVYNHQGYLAETLFNVREIIKGELYGE